MKMTTLRDQSKPVLYGLVVLFILAMGGFANILDSTNPNKGNSEFCDPEQYVTCSDDKNISISVDEFNRRFNNDINYWIGQATFNNQFNGIDKQIDTLNAKDRVWNSILNDRIRSKFIKELKLIPKENYSEAMIKFIKEYPAFNSNYKAELESYGLFMIDSAFNQVEYEKSVDNGTLDELINENFEINNPQLASITINKRWDNWLSTMKNNIASRSFTNIVNSVQSMSNLELREQLLIDSALYDFDYLIYSINTENEVDITEDELAEYYESIKDNNDYDLKNESKIIIEFVKWNTTDNCIELTDSIECSNLESNLCTWDSEYSSECILNTESIESIKKEAKEFRRTARKKGFETALANHKTFSNYHTVTLSNDFSTSKSGLSSQILQSDSTTTPLYNIIGAGRKVISFAFSNEVGEIKLLEVESDRETGGFDDIGVFHIKELVPESYTSIDEPELRGRLKKELSFKKNYQIGEKEFNSLMSEYKNYLIDEGADNLSSDELLELGLLYAWINNEDDVKDKILFNSHKGNINDFLGSFINTDLKDIINTNEQIKAYFLDLDKGLNNQMFAIDNTNIIMIRLNNISNIPSIEKITEYKKSELQRLGRSQANLFLLDQKETANIKDNRTLVY